MGEILNRKQTSDHLSQASRLALLWSVSRETSFFVSLTLVNTPLRNYCLRSWMEQGLLDNLVDHPMTKVRHVFLQKKPPEEAIFMRELHKCPCESLRLQVMS